MLCDAILGALALGDIGHHFPDTTQWENADTALRHVVSLMQDIKYAETVIAQSQNSQSMDDMKLNLVNDLHTSADQVNIKATTTEKWLYRAFWRNPVVVLLTPGYAYWFTTRPAWALATANYRSSPESFHWWAKLTRFFWLRELPILTYWKESWYGRIWVSKFQVSNLVTSLTSRKDKYAITTQWFCINLPESKGKIDSNPICA